MKRQLKNLGEDHSAKDEVLRTCFECKGVAEGRRENYTYSECGLKNVVLKNVMVHRCRRCGSECVDIPNMDGLHRTLALGVLCKRSLLSADEIRFLRGVAGFTATELSRSLGVTKAAVSRWENGAKIGGQSDRGVRLICGFAIMEEIVDQRCGAVNANDVKEAWVKLRRFFVQFNMKNVLANICSESQESEKLIIDPDLPFSFSLLPVLHSDDQSESVQ
jgi:putative zinc finger/helix-turn-helix YgiT family protein